MKDFLTLHSKTFFTAIVYWGQCPCNIWTMQLCVTKHVKARVMPGCLPSIRL